MSIVKTRKKNQSKKINLIIKKTPQAPEQYLGYSLQATRFLARLLEAEPGWVVSLEVFDDVGVETADGYRIAEQAKSAKGDNPISDRAEGLWKTFSNWIDAVERGDLQLEKTKFEIYVSPPRTGNIVNSFSNANSLEDARRALIEARNKLWGVAPDFNLKSEISSTIKKYVSKVFDTDESVICKIIQAFSLVCGSGNSQTDLKVLMTKSLVPQEIIDDVLRQALGWVKEQTDTLLEQNKPASIPVDRFRLELISFVRKYDRRTILCSFANDPSQREIDADLLRTYVRQLEIIDCEYDQKISAIIDFLRASTDRTQWSVKGLVHESSFDEFEKGLIRTWRNLKNRTDIALSQREDIEKGKYLYAECSNHHATLEGLTVPNHFTPGGFHALADKKEVGWHSNYKTLLKESRKLN